MNAQHTLEPMAKTRRFEGSLNTVSQTGAALSNPSPGINITLHFHSAYVPPHSAEVFSDDATEYADLGLEWDGKTLEGYDGAFELPAEVITFLKDEGFTMGYGIEDTVCEGTVCEECGTLIPDTGESVANRHHAEECSLNDPDQE